MNRVIAHQMATERRRQGKPSWDLRIPPLPYSESDDLETRIRRVASHLKGSGWPKAELNVVRRDWTDEFARNNAPVGDVPEPDIEADTDIGEVIYRMTDTADSLRDGILSESEAQDEFDECIDDMYTFADTGRVRVWITPRGSK